MRATLLNQTSPCYRTFPLQLFQIEFVHFVRCGKLFCNFHVRSALISRFPHQIRRLSSLKTDHSLLNATESLSHGCLITIFISLPFCGQQCYMFHMRSQQSASMLSWFNLMLQVMHLNHNEILNLWMFDIETLSDSLFVCVSVSWVTGFILDCSGNGSCCRVADGDEMILWSY